MVNMNQSYSEKIFDTKRAGNNLPSFLSKAGIRLSQTPDLDGHFTRTTITALMSKLFVARLPNVKYNNDTPNVITMQPQDGGGSGSDDNDEGNHSDGGSTVS
jgi:hypothetical protein